MNAVGIDVSKGKSMVAILRPLGEVVAAPFEVAHTDQALKELVAQLKRLDGETRVVMEYTGIYYQPIAQYLHEAGIFVSVVHALLVHDYGGNTIRRVKTDKKDAIKIAGYTIDHWLGLRRYAPEEEIRHMLKIFSRQYSQYVKTKTALKNNLIALLEQTLPGIRSQFTSPVRTDGHEKWIDFAGKFWHCDCITKLSENEFVERYNKWCFKHGYHGSVKKAKVLYTCAKASITTLPSSPSTKLLIQQAVAGVNAAGVNVAAILHQMQELAASLPEYPVVMDMYGTGPVIGPRLMAEIGDVRRFARKQSLVAFAGVDAPPHQSGAYDAKDRHISKRGSPLLRKVLFEMMICILKTSPEHDPVYQFIDRKRAEGKPYGVYMVAGANKFLRIYYARVTEYLFSFELAA